MIIFHSPECTKYEESRHPESPARVENTADILRSLGYGFRQPRAATETEVRLAHSIMHMKNLKGGKIFDADTPNFPQIYDLALLSAGSAIQAAQLSATQKESSFSLMRPPGHHACVERAMGFCYINNVAIAGLNSLRIPGIDKIAILDIDNHRGNGTQDIVQGIERILHVDIHCFPDYPDTRRPKARNCLNLPLPPKTSEDKYLRTLQTGLEAIKDFDPNLIIVSAGFDAYKEDPIGNLRLDVSSFGKIAERTRKLGKPICSVLEGGYNTEALPHCISNYIAEFGIV